MPVIPPLEMRIKIVWDLSVLNVLVLNGVIILTPFDVLLHDLAWGEKFSADLTGHVHVETFAAINVHRDKVLLGQGVDDDRTFDQRYPSGEPGFIRKPDFIASEDVGRGLFLHPQRNHTFVQKAIIKVKVVTDPLGTMIKIQEQLITKGLGAFFHPGHLCVVPRLNLLTLPVTEI